MTEEEKTVRETEEETPAEEKPEKKTRKDKAADKKLEKELEALRAELAELKDSYLRQAAEYDNFKKRTAREKDDLYFAAKCDVLKRLLPVFDNLERAGSASGEAAMEKRSFSTGRASSAA